MHSRPPIETFPYPLPLSEPSHIQHPVTGIGMTRSNRRSIMLAIIIITINAAGVSEPSRSRGLPFRSHEVAGFADPYTGDTVRPLCRSDEHRVGNMGADTVRYGEKQDH